MGYFKNIDLENFRNFKFSSFKFSKNCNVFFGKNGSGKTNILEAISLFAKGRGLKNDKLLNIIKKNEKKFIIKSDFENKNIIYNLQSESKTIDNRVLKNLSINKDTSKEILNSLYEFSPFMIFLPETERLFLSSPSNRRNFIDRFIFNHKNNYNKLINEYNKNILERSKILSSNEYDSNWLDRIEKNISVNAFKIYDLRKKQVNEIIKYLNWFLKEFNLTFDVSVKVIDNFFNENIDEDIYIQELKSNRKIDGIIGGAKIGPHKSDYHLYINKDYPASQLSTGQQKTLILLIFLSQSKYLIEIFNKKPILLLDEVCSHLDEVNRNILLTLIQSFDLQIFMTGTTKNLFSFLSTNTNFCNITSK